MKRLISKHVGCYGIVVNSKNQVLLIRKSRGAYKGKLDLPGGGIDFGETPEETLKREFQEEVGIAIEEFKIYTAMTHYEVWKIEEELEEDLRHYAIIYRVNITKDQEEKIKQEEDGRDSLGANWYDINSLKIEELSPLALVIKKEN